MKKNIIKYKKKKGIFVIPNNLYPIPFFNKIMHMHIMYIYEQHKKEIYNIIDFFLKEKKFKLL
jgi:hypothetical protein